MATMQMTDSGPHINESPRAPRQDLEYTQFVAKDHRYLMFACHFVILCDMTINIVFSYGVDDQGACGIAMACQILVFAVFFGLFRAMFSLTFVYQAGLISVLLTDFSGLFMSSIANLVLTIWVRVLQMVNLHKVHDTGIAYNSLDSWDEWLFYIIHTSHKISLLYFYYETLSTTFRLGEKRFYMAKGWLERITE